MMRPKIKIQCWLMARADTTTATNITTNTTTITITITTTTTARSLVVLNREGSYGMYLSCSGY